LVNRDVSEVEAGTSFFTSLIFGLTYWHSCITVMAI
jgi:hypothetical protein